MIFCCFQQWRRQLLEVVRAKEVPQRGPRAERSRQKLKQYAKIVNLKGAKPFIYLLILRFFMCIHNTD